MYMHKNLVRILAFLIFIAAGTVASAQQGLSFDLPKPKKFENRKLASEKTDEKKYTIPRRFMQNTITHYNYYFNANERINEILARAKSEYRDDYTQLLGFYNYELDGTAKFKNDLDSVIYKATAGILLHDLRTNWVDNLYMLIGRAYYLRKELDSAYMTFQYVNYAFSPKEKDGYDKVIGSNSNEGGNAFSISTNEKRNIAKTVLSRPPSRNESLIWQIKTYLANEEMPEAASLIQTLKHDPLFPSRLKTDLEEVQALYFYKQAMYDSAALHLGRALTNALNQQERSRWEYLIAQMHEASGKNDLAKEFYSRAVKHTIDPVMEVYGLMNAIRQDGGADEKAVQRAIDELAKMGRKDKYLDYRDIIYYAAARMELDRGQPGNARNFLNKSVKYSVNNPQQKSRSFMALAAISFDQKDFVNAKRFYDSVDISMVPEQEMATLGARKDALTVIAAAQAVITRQDSLQRLAAMTEAEREAFVKKLLKQLRKQQGLKEDDVSFGNTANVFQSKNDIPADLFNTGDAKAGWYFANTALVSKGYAGFRSKWGNRPNVDNWRRSAVLQQQTANNNAANGNTAEGITTQEVKPLNFENLVENVPTTPAKLKISNDSIMNAQFALGVALQEQLEDYPAAIAAYEQLLERFPTTPLEEQTLFNLYYCYKKTGQEGKLAQIKQTMESKYSNSQRTAIIKNPVKPDSLHKKEGAQSYEEIYNLFIEGRFDEALAKKRNADSIYGKYFWTPQLLYIESVYHIQQRNDDAAKSVLNNIVSMYPGTPMAARSQKLVEVLGRRKEIEDYLTKLEIQRPTEDSVVIVAEPPRQANPVAVQQNVPAQNQPTQPVVNNIAKPKSDTAQAIKQPVTVTPAPSSTTFVNAPASQHFVALVMDKVDPVYVNEARNAFNRYHKEKYYNKPLEITQLPLTDDMKFMLVGKFENAVEAMDYADKAKKLAPADIIPWMPAAKYSFIIITEANLEVLKNNKDVPAYRKFLAQSFPGSF
jgi:tetratricopeptide (TPR) repeat protein